MNEIILKLDAVSFPAGDFQEGPLNLEIFKNEYFVMMGATGSGKSLMLKSICGFIFPKQGQVVIDNIEITKLAPGLRGIGYVPQGSCLFPHMSVIRNITFSLENSGVKRGDAEKEVVTLIETLELEELLNRQPHTLSGGERQKVALARALAKKPKLLILDEPVGALDEPTRREICTVLKKVHNEFGVTTIHVCHSLDETAAVADRVGIMDAGKIVQCGTLKELKDEPANQAVKRLMNV